jgi:site-specific DNA-methyltransferase (adenine-specific)
MNQILQGDCLEVMQTLPDQSIGLVLADLPYGVTACHWDTVIDLAAMWVELKRLIQPKRALVFTATQPFTTDLICSNRDWFKYCWVWEKSQATGHLDARRKPMRTHEDLVVFAEAMPLYHPQERVIPKDKIRKQGHRSQRGCYGSFDFSAPRLTSLDVGFPKTILEFPSVNSGHSIHPTQKPVTLFEYLIRTYTNPGDVVLDPTAGSMTTAIACLNTGRGYICIEKDPDEYRKGLARVEAHLAKPQQFNLLEPTPALPDRATVEQGTIFDALQD